MYLPLFNTNTITKGYHFLCHFRKRSSDGSVQAVEESMPHGENTSFQTVKRQKRTSSCESTGVSSVSNLEKNLPSVVSDKSGEEVDDPFALDTEVSRTSRKRNTVGDKSRVQETQMTESLILHDKSVKTEKLEDSREGESGKGKQSDAKTAAELQKNRVEESQVPESEAFSDKTIKKENVTDSKASQRNIDVHSTTHKGRRRSRVEETQMAESSVILNNEVKKEATNVCQRDRQGDVDASAEKGRRRSRVEETQMTETLPFSESNIKKEPTDQLETVEKDNQSSRGGEFLLPKERKRSRVEETQLLEALAFSEQVVKREDERNETGRKHDPAAKKQRTRVEESQLTESLAFAEHVVKNEKVDDVDDRSAQESLFSAAVVRADNQRQTISDRSNRANERNYTSKGKELSENVPDGFLSTVAQVKAVFLCVLTFLSFFLCYDKAMNNELLGWGQIDERCWSNNVG